MIIENIRYTVLSRSEAKQEILPNAGDIFELKVRKMQFQDKQPESTETATIRAESVSMLGPYSRIVGLGNTDTIKDQLRCIAKYEATNAFPKGTPIGEVVFKQVRS